jgi:hypothetical protein
MNKLFKYLKEEAFSVWEFMWHIAKTTPLLTCKVLFVNFVFWSTFAIILASLGRVAWYVYFLLGKFI